MLASSINLCRIGQTEGLVFPPFEPIRHLIDEFISKGGKIYLLEPSTKSQLFDENNFIKGIEIADTKSLVQESIGATVFNY